MEEAVIRAEVREIMQKKFSAGRTTLGTNPGSHHEDSVKSGAATPSALVIDLVTESMQPPGRTPPSIIPGSPISVASTPSQARNGGRTPGFFHLAHATTAASPTKIFATMHWKLEEPLCFFGRNKEDVHTWTSLVRHCLSFMGGSDVQQVAYVHDENQDSDLDFWRIVVPDDPTIKEHLLRSCTVSHTVCTPESSVP